MLSDKALSYARILRSSSIIGGVSVANILIGLLRIKFIALLLGPTGLGLISLYSNLMSTMTTLSSMGMGISGARQVADALGKDNQRALLVARRAIFWGTLLLASSAALLIWSLREVLAIYVLGGIEHSAAVGWLGLGVALSVAVASQGALIQGMRRIGDMARLSVLGSSLNTLLGVILLWEFGQAGLVAFVLIGPLVSFALGYWFVSRLPKLGSSQVELEELVQQWKSLLRLGIPFMGAGLVGMVVQLWIRIEVGGNLGTEALGQFQAAWVISMQYVGLVLGAMSADYYPRLSSIIHDHRAATQLVNEQTEIALLLSAPIFISLLGLAPLVIQVLYSSDFSPAVEVLRWQVLGDVLKVVSWPLGFIILAKGDGKTFFWVETLAFAVMGGLIACLSNVIGLEITGIAFLLSYAVLLPVLYWLAKRSICFRWQKTVVLLFFSIFICCTLIFMLSSLYWWGMVTSVIFAICFGLYSAYRLSKLSNAKFCPLAVIKSKFCNLNHPK